MKIALIDLLDQLLSPDGLIAVSGKLRIGVSASGKYGR
jgi:hypothetical protein